MTTSKTLRRFEEIECAATRHRRRTWALEDAVEEFRVANRELKEALDDLTTPKTQRSGAKGK